MYIASVHKGRSLLRLLCAGLALLLLAAGCSLPKAPADLAWDTNLVVPFGVTTYSLSDLVDTPEQIADSGSGIGVDTTGLLYFSTFTPMSVPIKDSLVVDAFTSSPDPRKPQGIEEVTVAVPMLPQLHSLSSGLIDQGRIQFTISNLTTATPESIFVTVPSIEVDQLGTPLTIRVAAGSTPITSPQIQLHNATLMPTATTPQAINVRIQAPTDIEAVVHVVSSRITFSQYTGVLNGLVINAQNATTDVEPLPNGWEAVHPVDVSAYVHILPGFEATTDVDLILQSRRNGNLVATTPVSHDDIYLDRDTTLFVDGLAPMIAQYPDQVRTTGFLTLHGPIESTVADSVKMEIELRSALAFTLDTLVAPGETRSVDGGDDLSDIQSGSMRFRIWNRLPIGGTVKVYVGYDSARVADRTSNEADSVYVLATADVRLPAINPTTGRATDEAFSDDEIEIDSTRLDVFKAEQFYTRTEVRLGGSDGDVRRAYQDDYVKVQVIASIQYRVDTSSDDDDDDDDNGGNH